MCNGAAKLVSAGIVPCDIKNLFGNIIAGLKINVLAIIQNGPYVFLENLGNLNFSQI